MLSDGTSRKNQGKLGKTKICPPSVYLKDDNKTKFRRKKMLTVNEFTVCHPSGRNEEGCGKGRVYMKRRERERERERQTQKDRQRDEVARKFLKDCPDKGGERKKW